MVRKCAQAVCVCVILGGALYVAHFGKPPEQGSIAQANASMSEGFSIAHGTGGLSGDFTQTPAFCEFQTSLDGVRAARENLIQTAATGQSNDAVAAANDYRGAIRRLRAAYDRVKDRVAPGELASVLQGVYDPMAAGATGLPVSLAAYPWELGDLAQEVTP